MLATLVATSVGVACGDADILDGPGGEGPFGGEPNAGSTSTGGKAGIAGHGGVSEGGGGGIVEVPGGAGQGGARELPGGGAGGAAGEGGDGPEVTPPQLHCRGEGGAGGAQGDLVGGAGGSDSDEYTRTDLGKNTQAVAINALDQVLVNTSCKAYVIDGNDVTEVVVPGKPRCTSGVDISDVGTVVGTASFAKVGEEEDLRPFLWKHGEVTMLHLAEHGQPFMINNLEQLLLQGEHGAVLWNGGVVPVEVEGTPASPFFINNAGHVLAWTPTDDSWLIKGAQASKVPFDSAEPLQALSDTGLVVGIHDQVVAIWDGATVTKLDVVTEGNPGQVTDEEDDDGKVVVHAINGLGAFVGDYPYDNGEATRPFVFANGRTTRLSAGGSALDINASGVVVGNRWNNVWSGGLHGGYSRIPYGGSIWSKGCFSSCCASE